MGRKRRERLENEKKRKNRQRTIIALVSTATVCIIVALVMFAHSGPDQTATISMNKNEDGSLTVPLSALSANLNYIDYGYEQKLLTMIDTNGIVRTAYNTCVECYALGNTQYTLNGNTSLLCSACGNSFPLSTLGTSSWGGCQPVSIPPEYRQDNEYEITFPHELLSFAEEMFAQWSDQNYDLSLEQFEP